MNVEREIVRRRIRSVPIAPPRPNRRALILPGGGMRVAYQAGIVRALDEAGLRYSFADGASGGTMNLAALLSGATPLQLCERWRTLHARSFVSLRPVSAYAKFPNTGALGDFDSIRAKVFPHLGIDATAIRAARGVRATFNVCDFDDKIAVPILNRDISEELLLAAISLPLFTPPVRFAGRTWTDAVWIRDCNLMAAVEAGANELWVAWCIGNTPKFSDGLLEQYVHMIEMAAVGKLNSELAEIAAINERICNGERPHGHATPITVHLIKPEIPLPLDPDFVEGKIDSATLIARGYRDAVRYLRNADPDGIALDPGSTRMLDPVPGVEFRETMTGRITFGETDPASGAKSDAAMPVSLHAAVEVPDIAAFRRDPEHLGRIAGWVELHRRGGWLPVTTGDFGLFSPSPDPKLSYMIYAVGIRINGEDHWFNGRKHVRMGPPWKLWKATTTLYVTIHRGTSEAGEIVAAGILSLGPASLLRLLGTFRPTGCETLLQKARTAASFFAFFASELVRIYVTRRRLRRSEAA